jgi:hypothetical protein
MPVLTVGFVSSGLDRFITWVKRRPYNPLRVCTAA